MPKMPYDAIADEVVLAWAGTARMRARRKSACRSREPICRSRAWLNDRKANTQTRIAAGTTAAIKITTIRERRDASTKVLRRTVQITACPGGTGGEVAASVARSGPISETCPIDKIIP